MTIFREFLKKCVMKLKQMRADTKSTPSVKHKQCKTIKGSFLYFSIPKTRQDDFPGAGRWFFEVCGADRNGGVSFHIVGVLPWLVKQH